MQLPRWTSPYCDPDMLRSEVLAMKKAMCEALLERLRSGTVRALYAKGSATKPWTTPIDYVPEVSDVDVQIPRARTRQLGRSARGARDRRRYGAPLPRSLSRAAAFPPPSAGPAQSASRV